MNVTFLLDSKKSQTVPLINGTALYTQQIDTSVKHMLYALVGKDTLSYAVAAYINNNPGNSGSGGSSSGGVPGGSGGSSGGILGGNSSGSGSSGNGSSVNPGNSSENGSGNNQFGNGITKDSSSLNNVGSIIAANVGSSTSAGGGQESYGDKATEVSIENSVNSVKDNPYTNLGIIVLLSLVGVGYFKRNKSR